LAWVVLVALPAAPARAASVLIAEFSPVSGSYAWTNTSGVIGKLSASAQVDFNFVPGSGQSTAVHSATVTITALSTLAATVTPAGPDQPINVPSQITIVDNGPAHAMLLSATFTGDLLALTGTGSPGSSAQLSGSHTTYATPAFGAGSFTITMPTLSPNIILTDGIFSSFTATGGTGVFFSSIPLGPAQLVPAPGSVAMFGTGIAAVALLVLGRDRLAKIGRRRDPGAPTRTPVPVPIPVEK
jgi:hypothetical protein